MRKSISATFTNWCPSPFVKSFCFIFVVEYLDLEYDFNFIWSLYLETIFKYFLYYVPCLSITFTRIWLFSKKSITGNNFSSFMYDTQSTLFYHSDYSIASFTWLFAIRSSKLRQFHLRYTSHLHGLDEFLLLYIFMA